MPNPDLIQVNLDQDLVKRLLTGLNRGAARKALKVIISTDGNYHIESKELRMSVQLDAARKTIASIHIHNGKQSAVITAGDLDAMRLTSLAQEVVKELRDQYSPVFHSLADNIIVFSRAYGNPSVDNYGS